MPKLTRTKRTKRYKNKKHQKAGANFTRWAKNWWLRKTPTPGPKPDATQEDPAVTTMEDYKINENYLKDKEEKAAEAAAKLAAARAAAEASQAEQRKLAAVVAEVERAKQRAEQAEKYSSGMEDALNELEKMLVELKRFNQEDAPIEQMLNDIYGLQERINKKLRRIRGRSVSQLRRQEMDMPSNADRALPSRDLDIGMLPSEGMDKRGGKSKRRKSKRRKSKRRKSKRRH